MKKSKQKYYNLKSRYGVEKEFVDFIERKFTKCEICKVPFSQDSVKMCYDHCHETNRLRGLLCQDCNLGLGFFKDNTKLLDRAKKYLQKNDDMRNMCYTNTQDHNVANKE